MHPLDRYYYNIGGREYSLDVIGHKVGNCWRCDMARLYDMQDNFIGTWDREEMPAQLRRWLDTHLKTMELLGISADGLDWLDRP
jgi:hypothetical protein